MKLKELLKIRPDEVKIGHLQLESGRTIQEVLIDLDALGDLPPEGIVTVSDLNRCIGRLTEEQYKLFIEKELDPMHDNNDDTEVVEKLNSIIGDNERNDERDRVGRRVTYAMVICCMAIISVICYVSIVNKQFPDAFLSVITVGFLAMIGWFYMGLINKERRDILSVLVGEKVDNGIVESIFNAVINRRKK